MKTKKKQIIFITCVVVLVICGIVFMLKKNQKKSYSSDFQESSRQNTVVYGGKEYRYDEHLSNYLFMGIDTREPVTEYDVDQEVGRADAIFLLSYNRVEKTLKCISIPRDTMTNVTMIAPDGTDLGTSVEHINMQYVFGDGRDKSCQLMKKTVSQMFYDIPIQGYCALNMDGISVAVETLDGVEMILPDDSLKAVNAEYVEGAKILVTKENAEQVVRYRDTNESHSAIVRTNRQKELMKAVFGQAKQKSANDVDFLVNMYDSLKPYMVTNMGNDVLADVLDAKFDSKADVVDVPGQGVEGEQYDEYHVDETKLYELVIQMFYKEM